MKSTRWNQTVLQKRCFHRLNTRSADPVVPDSVGTLSLAPPPTVMSHTVSMGVREGAGLWIRVWLRFVGVSSTLLMLHFLMAPCDISVVGVASACRLPGA